MKTYTITYIQECTQPVKALTIQDAAAYAKKFAANSHMIVLRVEPANLLPSPAV